MDLLALLFFRFSLEIAAWGTFLELWVGWLVFLGLSQHIHVHYLPEVTQSALLQCYYIPLAKWSDGYLSISAGLMGKIMSGSNWKFLESGEVKQTFSSCESPLLGDLLRQALVQPSSRLGLTWLVIWKQLGLSQTKSSCCCQGVEACCHLNMKGKKGLGYIPYRLER